MRRGLGARVAMTDTRVLWNHPSRTGRRDRTRLEGER